MRPSTRLTSGFLLLAGLLLLVGCEHRQDFDLDHAHAQLRGPSGATDAWQILATDAVPKRSRLR